MRGCAAHPPPVHGGTAQGGESATGGQPIHRFPAPAGQGANAQKAEGGIVRLRKNVAAEYGAKARHCAGTCDGAAGEDEADDGGH